MTTTKPTTGRTIDLTYAANTTTPWRLSCRALDIGRAHPTLLAAIQDLIALSADGHGAYIGTSAMMQIMRALDAIVHPYPDLNTLRDLARHLASDLTA